MFMGILAPILIDEYAPSMPAMVHALNSSANMIQRSIIMMLFGLCLGQVVLAPLSDRFGRRIIIMIGVSLACLATLLCIVSTNATELLIGRFLQGFGIGAAALTTTALIGELFEGDEINRVTAIFILVYGLVPIVAPVVGGYIQDGFGWRANFVLMFCFLIVGLLFFIWKMPETIDRKTTTRLSLSHLTKAYGAVLSNKRYLSAVFGAMFSWAVIITFSLLAPFLIQNHFGYSATVYGYLALVAGLGFLLGNIWNNVLLKKYSPKTVLQTGVTLSLLAGVLVMLFYILGAIYIWTLMIPAVLMMLGVGLTFPNYYAFAVSVFTENYVGVANALIGALILLGTVIFSSLLSAFHAESFVVFAVVYLAFSLLNLISAVICLRQQSK
jgi:DHA1 family bicyclomycin/chloramphenicol resistance-like MFS transporter/DHA1 family 2-module integral membrane pump EmrD-like MFS transporter